MRWLTFALTFARVAGKCRDLVEQSECLQRAACGNCTLDPETKRQCSWTCNACSRRETEPACRRTNEVPLVPSPGGVSAAMKHVIDTFPELEPKALSTEPWVVRFEQFVSPAEAARA